MNMIAVELVTYFLVIAGVAAFVCILLAAWLSGRGSDRRYR